MRRSKIFRKITILNMPRSFTSSNREPLFLKMVEMLLSFRTFGEHTSFLTELTIKVMALRRSAPQTPGLNSSLA